jgi:4-amino-4-deoxy-L-arabinose transferase-like glycosyltransferase
MVPSSPGSSTMARSIYWALLFVIIAAGAFVRLYPSAAFTNKGFDEAIYTSYVKAIEKRGLLQYPDLCQGYVELQTKEEAAILPPTRFLYVYAAHLWHVAFGGEAYRALVNVSAIFTILVLFVTAGFSFRLGGPQVSLATTAVMSMAMNEIHQAQHAMIDGFFTFWCLVALWSLWENLQQPGRKWWLIIYGLSLAAMVTTKENSFFVVVAICGLLLANHWLRFGTATKPLFLTTILGPLAGFVFLVFLSEGLDIFIKMYRLLVEKSKVLPYAIINGDGPWYRYLVDLMVICPLVMLLAIGRSFCVKREDKAVPFLLVFIGFTFAIMSSVKYGFNARYTTIWDMPLRYLAVSQVALLANRAGRHGPLIMVLATIGLAAFELYQYFVFCVQFPAYALVGNEIFRAVRIIK